MLRPVAFREAPLAWLVREALYLTGPALGYAFILAVCVIWVAGSFLVESLEAAGLSPLLLTYICNSLFVVLLPVYYANEGVKKAQCLPRMTSRLAGDGRGGGGGVEAGVSSWQRLETDDGEGAGDESGGGGSDISRARRRTPSGDGKGEEEFPTVDGGLETESGDEEEGEEEDQTVADTVRAAIVIAPLWFVAQLCFNYSLLLTSVTSNSILSTSSSVFTFALSVWLVNERFSWTRLGAIFVYVMGSCLVTVADNKNAFFGDSSYPSSSHSGKPANSTWGNVLCVLAAAMYAGYTAGIKYMLPDDSKVSMLLFLGALGLANLLGVGAVIVAGRMVGVFPELFSNVTWTVFAFAVLKGLVDNVLSDYLWARAVLLTSPTNASVGLSMQIPMAAAVEVLIGHARWMREGGTIALMGLGCAMVMTGFLGVVFK